MVGINKKQNWKWICPFVVIIFIMMVSPGKAGMLDDEKGITAYFQWSVPYRFGENLKVGDWVRYRSLMPTDGPPLEIELKVEKKQKDGFWIVEKYYEGEKQVQSEIHIFVDLKEMKLIQVFMGEEGQKLEATLLEGEKVTEIIQKAIEERKKQLQSAWVGYNKYEKLEEIEVPAGTFKCTYLEGKLNEKMAKILPSEKIAEMEHGSRYYFSEDIPRLLPSMFFAMHLLSAPDTFKDMKGGLVKGAVELVAYSGQKE